MSFKVKKRICILLISLLILLALVPVMLFRKTQPEGEYITGTNASKINKLINNIQILFFTLKDIFIPYSFRFSYLTDKIIFLI